MNENDSEYIATLKERIKTESYGLEYICELTRHIQANFEKALSKEFLLRNAEVTIRNDVTLYPYSTFNQSGKAFAHYIERAFS